MYILQCRIPLPYYDESINLSKNCFMQFVITNEPIGLMKYWSIFLGYTCNYSLSLWYERTTSFSCSLQYLMSQQDKCKCAIPEKKVKPSNIGILLLFIPFRALRHSSLKKALSHFCFSSSVKKLKMSLSIGSIYISWI